MKKTEVTNTKALVSMEYLQTDVAEDVKEHAENYLEELFKIAENLKVKQAEAEAKLKFYQQFDAAQWNHHMRSENKDLCEKKSPWMMPFYSVGGV